MKKASALSASQPPPSTIPIFHVDSDNEPNTLISADDSDDGVAYEEAEIVTLGRMGTRSRTAARVKTREYITAAEDDIDKLTEEDVESDEDQEPEFDSEDNEFIDAFDGDELAGDENM